MYILNFVLNFEDKIKLTGFFWLWLPLYMFVIVAFCFDIVLIFLAKNDWIVLVYDSLFALFLVRGFLNVLLKYKKAKSYYEKNRLKFINDGTIQEEQKRLINTVFVINATIKDDYKWFLVILVFRFLW